MTNWATKQEAAEHVRVSSRLIQQAVQDGDLKSYRVGNGNRDYRLDLDEVDEWMRARPYEPRSA